MKKIALVLIFLLGLFFTAKTIVYSQGRFGCYEGPPGTQCTTLENCDPGYVPAFKCADYTAPGCPIGDSCVLPGAPPTVTPPPILPTSTPGLPPCGNLGQPCCGTIPPLYCNSPYIPSNDQSPFVGCTCLDPAGLITPPPESGCISYPKGGCPSWAPNACYDSNYVWCCPDIVACADAKEIISLPPNNTEVSCTTRDGKDGVQTALGCIPTEPMDLVKWLFPYLLGFGGLAAFGLIVYSGFQLMTSSGDPQKIQGAKETITSAVTGLIFIILSLFLLRLIGVDILGLPGLE